MIKKLFGKTKKFIFTHCFSSAYQIILTVLMVGIIVLTAFHLSSHRLLGKSFFEFIDSIVYYFRSMFSEEPLPKDNVSVLTFDESIISSVLPVDIEVFGYRFLSWGEIMVNGAFIKTSWSAFLIWLSKAANIFLLFAMPVFILIYVYYNFVIFKNKISEPKEQSRPLKIFFWIQEHIYYPVKLFLLKLWIEFRYNKIFFFGFILLGLYNVNILSFILTFLAWYFYFVFSVDFISLWVLICKFVICISPLLRPFFWPFWILGTIILIEYIKIRIAFTKLEVMYAKNDDFVSELGIITGIYGVPGAGKNLLEVAIATQKEVLLRRQAFDSMMEIRSEFPDFPFRYLELDVEKARMSHSCVNKIQIEEHFRESFKNKKDIYGYDLASNKSEHYDKLKVSSIVDELLDYAQLYYIYISSLAASTYSLRYDIGVKTGHAFPGLRYNFFHRDFRNDEESVRAKIFDLNFIRLGEQLDSKSGDFFKPNEDKNFTFADAGVFTFSEFGKDRGNRYTNQARKDNKVKPSNDGTANCLGVLRHLSTVRHKQYAFILWDDQKLSAFSGLEAAMAETNIFIGKQKKKTKITLPLWFFEGVILDWFSDRYNRLYQKYMHMRNDQTLFSYIVSHISSFFNNLNRGIINTFGYRKLVLSLSGVNVNGSQEKSGEDTFYLMNKIIFSNRYRTDCYKGFFDKLKLQAKGGINELDEFEGEAASIIELQKTNGYFSTDLAMQILEKYKLNEKAEKEAKKKKEKAKKM